MLLSFFPRTVMTRAIWKGAVLAQSDACRVVEGNHYFPPDAVDRRYLQPSATHTRCNWKGVASYYHVIVNDAFNRDAAWNYPEPLPAAKEIAGYIAFRRGVQIVF